MNTELITTLRHATANKMPGSAAWANSDEARAIKGNLRPVLTRVAHGVIAA